MGVIFQFGVVIFISFVGVFVSSFFNIPIPGSVLAMMLFYLFLEFGVIKSVSVDKACDFLCANMALLFIPLNVGIMVSYKIFEDKILSVVLTVILSTFVGILCSYLGVIAAFRLLGGGKNGSV